MAEKSVAASNSAGHRAVPLPIARSIGVRPLWRLLPIKTEYRHWVAGGVGPNTNAIVRPHQVGMGIESGVHQRNGYALARESGIGVKSKACRKNTEGGLGVQRPGRLNRFMESGVSLAKQRPQQILLDACWTPTIGTSPKWVQSGLG